MNKFSPQFFLYAGLTAVFVGYFAVWLPGPGAGLQFIGLEMGEMVKFNGVGPIRNWFYWPPLGLGLILALLTAVWPNDRLQTWGMRGLAVAVSLLAFPAVEDITGPVWRQYAVRIVGIGLVIAVAGLAGWLVRQRRSPLRLPLLVWGGCALLGLIGLIAPLVVYLAVRPLFSGALGLPLGFGPGLWLNGLGHGLITAVALWQLATKKDDARHRLW